MTIEIIWFCQKKINPIVLWSKQTRLTNIFYWENHDFILKVFYMVTCEYKSMSQIFFKHIHQKSLVNTLLLAALKYDHKKRKNSLLQTQAIPFHFS